MPADFGDDKLAEADAATSPVDTCLVDGGCMREAS